MSVEEQKAKKMDQDAEEKISRMNYAEEQNGLLHPFEVFPEELWPKIAEKLEDSSEISRLINAIPEITDVMQHKKPLWLFDQVIPLVTSCLKKKDLLACRLVCKPWSRAVDNFLDNHPKCRPYCHEKQVTGQVWILGDRPAKYLYPIELYFMIPWIEDPNTITNFLQDMDKESIQGNPIVGRSLSIDLRTGNVMLRAASRLFRRFGEHIWFLTLYNFIGDYQEFYTRLGAWIDYLPNLKKLRLLLPTVKEWNISLEIVEKAAGEYAVVESSSSSMNVLPPLPYLEALEIVFEPFPLRLLRTLVNSYAQQIRRLEIVLKFWRKEFSDKFPNLTELIVSSVGSAEGMAGMLLSIEAPLLYEICLSEFETFSIDVEKDIFPWLRRFPLIRNLSLPDTYTAERKGGDGMSIGLEESIPSLKYLYVTKDCLHVNSDFLLCFPNLESLTLGNALFRTPEGEPHQPKLRIWENIWNGTLYESNVWELLPRLKRIGMWFYGVDGQQKGSYRQYNREGYEYRRRHAKAN